MTGAFAEVLARYPQPIRSLDWSQLGASGGLSGATIWRGGRAGEPLFYAKGYPPGVDPLDISLRHRWCAIASQAGLKFVPALVATSAGDTFTIHRSQCWEIGGWMPGAPDFTDRPTPRKLLAACDAVIGLLDAWRRIIVRHEVPSAVRNRLALIEEWESDPPLDEAVLSPDLQSRARTAIAAHLPAAKASLAPGGARARDCRLCVRDLRAEHFLFTGEELTGLIDYGAVAVDTPSTDAARMLGELAGDDAELYGMGIARFAVRLGPGVCPPELVGALDHSGVVGSVIHWLLRLHRGEMANVPNAEVETRLLRLVGRLERLSENHMSP